MELNFANMRGAMPLSFALAGIVSFLNETVFEIRSLSMLISMTFLAAVVASAALRRYRVLFWLFSIVFILFATRPRYIHLIDIDLRGAYDYYSPNILSLAGPSVSTLAVFLVFLILLINALSNPNRTVHKRFLALIFFAAASLTVTSLTVILVEHTVSIGNIVSDLKYFLFIFTGALIMQRAQYTIAELQSHVVFMGLTLGFAAVILFGVDMASGRLLLQYNHNTYFSIIALGVVLYSMKIRGVRNIAVFALVAIGAFPIVRGEQLIFAATLLIALGFLFIDRDGKSRGFKITLITVLVFASITYISSVDNALTQFFMRKFSLFLSANLLIDQSSTIRVLEFQAIFRSERFADVLTMIFGHGLGGNFSLAPSDLYRLTLADFPANEIYNNRFSQPHLFLSYWLLKFGMLGTVALLGIFLIGLPTRSVAFRIFLIALPALFWQAYWSPGYALFMGFFWAPVVLATRIGAEPRAGQPITKFRLAK